METIPLEMDDIFDDENDDVVPSRLPDLDELDLEGGLEPMRDSRYDESNEQGDEQPLTDDPELLEKLKSLKGASKNIARKTFIKLDATRLTGERGIPVLPKVFSDVKLKGKNHEVEDLKTIMHHLEHWAHRLFPKMPFDEVLERTERLGGKTEVKTCIKRIRLGMPVLATDVADEEDVHREGDEGEQRKGDESEQREGNSSITSSNQVPDDEIVEMEMDQRLSQEEEEVLREVESIPKQNTEPMNSSLSDEVKARIERNKKLAMEKRAARLAKANNSNIDVESSNPSSSHNLQKENVSETETSLNMPEELSKEGVGSKGSKEVSENAMEELGETDNLNLKDKSTGEEKDILDHKETNNTSENEKDTNMENEQDRDSEIEEHSTMKNVQDRDRENEENPTENLKNKDSENATDRESEFEKDIYMNHEQDKNSENEDPDLENEQDRDIDGENVFSKDKGDKNENLE